MEGEDRIEIEELEVWNYQKERLLDLLNGDVSVEQSVEDIKSFRNSIYYTGTNPDYKIVKEDD